MVWPLMALGAVALFIWYNWSRKQSSAGSNQGFNRVLPNVFSGRKCRWEPLNHTTQHLQEFRCKHCGVSAYSSSPKGPHECKRMTRGGL